MEIIELNYRAKSNGNFKFKVGDKVRINSPTYSKCHGMQGVITKKWHYNKVLYYTIDYADSFSESMIIHEWI